MTTTRLLAGAMLLQGVGCTTAPDRPSSKSQLVVDMKRATDHHSYSKPEEAVTTHLDWDAKVDFDARQVTATATYAIEIADDAKRLLLDSRDLTIHSVAVDGVDTEFELGPERPFIGQPPAFPSRPHPKGERPLHHLTGCRCVLGGRGDSPFLFTPSQAILARTWVPCQTALGALHLQRDVEVLVFDGPDECGQPY